MRFWFLALLAGFLSLASPASAVIRHASDAPAEREQHYSLDYQIYGGGIHAIDATVKIDIQPNRIYQGQVDAETRGTMADLFPWHNHILSNGLLKARNLQPVYHYSANDWFGKHRSVEIRYQNGDVQKIETVPTAAQDARDQVTAEQSKGTVDIITGALTFLQRVSLGESCNQKILIFDGRRVFNLVISDQGSETIAPSKYNIYSGTTKVCDLSLERVAGFWRKSQAAWTEDGDAKLRLTFWLAQLEPGGKYVPVKARSYGEFGTAFAHLHNATVNGSVIAPPKED